MNVFDTVVQLLKVFTLTVATVVLWEKVITPNQRKGLYLKSRRCCSLGWGSTPIFNLIIILHKYHRSLLQNPTQGFTFLLEAPHKIKMYRNARQSRNWQTVFKLGIVTSYRDALSLFFSSIPGDQYDAFLDTYPQNIVNSVRSQTGISQVWKMNNILMCQG